MAEKPMPTIKVGSAEEVRRRKVVVEAQEHMDRHLTKKWRGRNQALESIACHQQPMRRAKQIVAFEQRRRLFGDPVVTVAEPARPKVRRSKLRLEQIAAAGEVVDDRPRVAYTWPKDHKDAPTPVADLSDVQELIVRQKNKGRYEPLQVSMVKELTREVARGAVDRAAFEARAAEIELMPDNVAQGTWR